MSEKCILRKYLPEDYTEMMKTESHHAHEIVMVDEVIRWKANEGVRELVDSSDLNEIIFAMSKKGIDKNNEIYRRLYRNMGYSLSGYWEIFYWEMNNEQAHEYKPPTSP